jgi:CRP/FNR family transcriptional regulator
MTADDLLLLRQLPYFRGLRPEEVELLQRQAYRRDLAAGEMILLEGEPVEGLYVVSRGRVRTFRSTPEGREQVLFVLGPGDTFNDAPAFDGGVNLASAQALSSGTTIYLLPASLMTHLMAVNASVAVAVVGVLVGRVRQLAGLAEDLSLRTTTQRVAKLLLEDSTASNTILLNTQEIASRIGTVREVVSRSLRHLEQAGAITHRDNHLLLVDPQILRALLSEAEPDAARRTFPP